MTPDICPRPWRAVRAGHDGAYDIYSGDGKVVAICDSTVCDVDPKETAELICRAVNEMHT